MLSVRIMLMMTLKAWFTSRINALNNNDIEKVQALYTFYFWAKSNYQDGDLAIKSMLEWNEEFKKFMLDNFVNKEANK